MRRTGYQSFMRNIAIGLGNAPFDEQIVQALHQQRAIMMRLYRCILIGLFKNNWQNPVNFLSLPSVTVSLKALHTLISDYGINTNSQNEMEER